ncbi:MAG: TerB family tellurite resistance protein [Pseudomonadota bacterium]
MINIVKRFFSEHSKTVNEEGSADRGHDIQVATCALFLEMAHIDVEFSDSERENLVRTFNKEYHLSEETVSALMEEAQKELEGSLDLWQFTSLINQDFTPEEKMRVIEMVWKLAYIDGKLDSHEDYLMHKLANLLRLTHKQLIEAKMRVLKE